MTNEKNKISIIIPAYNEQGNISLLLKEISNTFQSSKFKEDYEIIIINDGSSDDTEIITKKNLSLFKNTKLINLKINAGKAYALDAGIKHSSGNIIATIDADLQYSSDNLIKMVDLITKGYDLINGKREGRKDSYLTVIFSKIYNNILKFFFRVNFDDFFSGIKVYKKEIYELMDYNGMARFVIFYSKIYKFNIKEVGVIHKDRYSGKPSYNFFNKIILSVQDIFSLIFCVYFDKKSFLKFKLFILGIYFIVFLILIIQKFILGVFLIDYLYYVITSLLVFFVFILIVQSFLNAKEKSKLNLVKNIIS